MCLFHLLLPCFTQTIIFAQFILAILPITIIMCCISPPFLLLFLSRPLQDGDIINIDVTVSCSYCYYMYVHCAKIVFDQLFQLLVATGRTVDGKCSLHR